jgi:hypothetical protein
MSEKPDYLDDLILELRMLDVPGEHIGQIEAEAENHLAESGQAPEVAFGPARNYARELWSREDRQLPGQVDTKNPFALLVNGMGAADWAIALVSFVFTTLGAAALLNGALAALFGVGTFLGLPAWVLMAVGVLLLGAFFLGARRLDDPIVDPRTGARVDFDRRGRRKTSS